MDLFEINKEIFFIINQKITNYFLDFAILYILIPLFSLLVLVPFYFLFKDKKFLGLFSLFCGFFLYWFGHSILKPIFNIPRPSVLFESVRILGGWQESPYSFPSSTTMLAFGLALPIFLHQRKAGTFLLVLAFLVGFCVIYAGFHTPLDVLAGILISYLFIFVLEKILKIENV